MEGKKRVRLNRKFIRMRLAELGENASSIAERSTLGVATWNRVLSQSDWNFTSETLAALASDLQCSPADLLDTEGHTSPLVAASALVAAA